MSLNFVAEAFAELVHVDVAFAETGNLACRADFFEFLLYTVGIVGFGDFNDDKAFELARLFKCYIHYVFVFQIIIFLTWRKRTAVPSSEVQN